MWVGVFLSLWVALLALHPIHVSVTELNYNAPELTLEISHRIFRDDAELALERFAKRELSLEAEGETPGIDSLLTAYLSRTVQLSIDGRPVKPRYLGKEYDHEAVWIYLELIDQQPYQRLDIRQQVLFEVYDDQSSLINYTVGSQLRSARLHRGNPEAGFPTSR